MKSSIFSKDDVCNLKESVRNDSYWKFFKKNIKTTHKNKKIIICEIGCGMGSNAILCRSFLKDTIDEYIAIDGSKEMLKYLEKENIEFVKTKLQNCDLDFSFPKADVYIIKFTFHHLKNKKQILKNIFINLNLEGKVLIVDKFPKFWVFSILLEKILDILNIRKIYGSHQYIRLKKFQKIAEDIGFKVNIIKTKSGKKITNFFMIKAFIILQKK